VSGDLGTLCDRRSLLLALVELTGMVGTTRRPIVPRGPAAREARREEKPRDSAVGRKYRDTDIGDQ